MGRRPGQRPGARVPLGAMRRLLAVLGAGALLLLAGCGADATRGPEQAGGPVGSGQEGADPSGAATSYDPRTAPLKCITGGGLPAHPIATADFEAGRPGLGPFVHYVATEGAGEDRQLKGGAEGAEVIGRALLYTREASEPELHTVERCLSAQVGN